MNESDASGSGLMDFLEWAGNKGEMSTATAQGWTVACRAVLSLFDEPTTVAIRSLDVAGTLNRFENKFRTKYSPGTMNAYKRRFEQATASYLAWLDSDPNWNTVARTSKDARPAQRVRVLRKANGRKEVAEDVETASVNAAPAPAAAPHSMVAYDLPLRPNLLVRLTLPIDLNKADAERISAFVGSLAFSTPTANSDRASVTSGEA